MKLRGHPLPWLCAVAMACGGGSLGGSRDASTRHDAASADASLGDSGLDDSSVDSSVDSSLRDSGRRDAAPSDAGADTGASDSGRVDAGGTSSSGGSGGAFPGAQTRTAHGAAGDVAYELYIPTSYDPGTAMPLLSVFHGQGDSGASMRDFWATTAGTNGFIVLATSSTGASGGWLPSSDVPRYDAALTDALAAYAIDTSRLYLWGFSAGAHLVHAIGLENADTFAAYSVSAGVLAALEGADGPSRASRHIPTDIHIGTDDPLFPQASSDRAAFLAAGWVEGADFSFVTFAGGHTVRADQQAEIWAFLSRYRR